MSQPTIPDRNSNNGRAVAEDFFGRDKSCRREPACRHGMEACPPLACAASRCCAAMDDHKIVSKRTGWPGSELRCDNLNSIFIIAARVTQASRFSRAWDV